LQFVCLVKKKIIKITKDTDKKKVIIIDVDIPNSSVMTLVYEDSLPSEKNKEDIAIELKNTKQK